MANTVAFSIVLLSLIPVALSVFAKSYIKYPNNWEMHMIFQIFPTYLILLINKAVVNRGVLLNKKEFPLFDESVDIFIHLTIYAGILILVAIVTLVVATRVSRRNTNLLGKVLLLLFSMLIPTGIIFKVLTIGKSLGQ